MHKQIIVRNSLTRKPPTSEGIDSAENISGIGFMTHPTREAIGNRWINGTRIRDIQKTFAGFSCVEIEEAARFEVRQRIARERARRVA